MQSREKQSLSAHRPEEEGAGGKLAILFQIWLWVALRGLD